MAKRRNLRIYQDEFISLYKEGVSIRQIAEKYEVNKNSVSALIKEKIELRPKSSISKEIGKNIYKDYLSGMSTRQLEAKYSVHSASIQRFLTKQYKIKFYGNKKYEHLTDDFIRCYEEGMSLADIGDKYGVSKQTVLTYLNQNDKDARTYKESSLKYEVDSNYFNKLNEEKAFDLGLLFFMTTISITNHRQEFLNIKTNIVNEGLLVELVSKFSDKNSNSVEYSSRNGKVTTASIRIYEQNIVNNFKSYGLGMENQLNIDTNYLYDFFRGYFSLALTVNTKTLNLSIKNLTKDIVKSYLNDFMDITLLTENKSAFIIGNIDGSIQFLKKHKELVSKVENCMLNNENITNRDLNRWENIINKTKE